MVDIHKIQNAQKKGFLYFVFVHGVLSWGLGTAVLVTVMDHLLRKTFQQLNFLIFPTLGLAWGAAMWWYLKWLLKRNS